MNKIESLRHELGGELMERYIDIAERESLSYKELRVLVCGEKPEVESLRVVRLEVSPMVFDMLKNGGEFDLTLEGADAGQLIRLKMNLENI